MPGIPGSDKQFTDENQITFNIWRKYLKTFKKHFKKSYEPYCSGVHLCSQVFTKLLLCPVPGMMVCGSQESRSYPFEEGLTIDAKEK